MPTSNRPCSISFPASPAPQRIFEPPQHKKATDNGGPNPPMPCTTDGYTTPNRLRQPWWVHIDQWWAKNELSCTPTLIFGAVTHLMSVGAKMTKSPPTHIFVASMHLYIPTNRSIEDSMLWYERAACFLVRVTVTARLFQIDSSLFCHYIGTTNLMWGDNNNVNRG